MSKTLPSPLTLLPSELELNQWLNPSPDVTPEQNLILDVRGLDSAFEETKPMPSQLVSLRPRRGPTKARGLRVSDKKDLTCADLLVVADLLISNDATSYFLNNCYFIYKDCMPIST